MLNAHVDSDQIKIYFAIANIRGMWRGDITGDHASSHLIARVRSQVRQNENDRNFSNNLFHPHDLVDSTQLKVQCVGVYRF